ncbi:hypothetical protein [Winogradskyella sp.]|uniref:hypothetical protein n=1 Tax=Winogradskyella sp. TaxID=1883156 RepID=UPI003BACCC36
MLSNYFNFDKASRIKDNFISFDKPLKDQLDDLYEDMFYSIYEDISITLDIGWYGSTKNLKGVFILYLIKEDDWDNPILKLSTKDLSILRHYIKSSVEFIDNQLINSGSD